MKLAAISRTVGHLSKSAEVMKLVNNLMKAPEVAATMQEFSKEMTKVSLHLWTSIHSNSLLVRMILFDSFSGKKTIVFCSSDVHYFSV